MRTVTPSKWFSPKPMQMLKRVSVKFTNNEVFIMDAKQRVRQAFSVPGTNNSDALEHVLPSGKGHGNAGERVERVLKC